MKSTTEIKCERCSNMVQIKLSYRGARLNSKYCKKCVKIVRKETLAWEGLMRKRIAVVFFKIKKITNKRKPINIEEAGYLYLRHLETTPKEKEEEKAENEFMKKMYKKYKTIDTHHQEIMLKYLRWEG